MAIGVRRQVESLLTKQQLAAVKDVVFRETALEVLAIGRVKEKLGLSREQKISLGNIRRDSAGASLSFAPRKARS